MSKLNFKERAKLEHKIKNEKILLGKVSSTPLERVIYQITGTNQTAIRLFVPKLHKVCHHHPMTVTLCQNDDNYYLSFKYPDHGKKANSEYQKLYHHIACWLGDWCDFKIKSSDYVLSKDTHVIFKYDSVPDITESMQHYNERDLWVDLIQNHAKSFIFWNLSIPKIGDSKDLKAIIKILTSFEQQVQLVKYWHESNRGKKKVKKSPKLLAKLRKLSEAAFPAAWKLASSDIYARNDINQIKRIFMAIRAVRTSPNWLNAKDPHYMYPFQGLSNRRILDLDIEAAKIIKLLHPKLLKCEKDTSPVLMYMFCNEPYGIYTTRPKIISKEFDLVDPGLNSRQIKELLLQIQDKLGPSSEVTPIFDDPNITAVNNGIYNFRTKELMPFSPKFVITTKLLTNYNLRWRKYYKASIPFKHLTNLPKGLREFNPRKMINNLADNNPAREMTLWQLPSDVFSTTFSHHRAFMLLGPAHTGKSCYVQLITNVIGASNVSSISIERLGDKYSSGQLEGKVSLISNETDSDAYLSKSSKFKSLVESEPIQVENKFEDPFTERFLNLSIVQCGNKMFKMKNSDVGALSRRLEIVNFKNTNIGKHANPEVKNNYICTRAFREWFLYTVLNSVHQFKNYTISKEDHKLAVKEIYRSSPVLRFLKGQVMPVINRYHDSLRQIMKSYLYQWYVNWSNGAGLRTMKENKFLSEFKDNLDKMYNDKGINPPLVEDRCTVAKSSAATLKNIASNDPSSEMPITRPENGNIRIRINDPRYFGIMGYVNKTERMYVINDHFTWKDDYKDSIEAISRVPEDYYIFKDWLYAREMKYLIYASSKKGQLFTGMNIAGVNYDVETTMSIFKKLRNSHPDEFTLRKHLKGRLSNWRVIFDAIKDFGKRRFKGLPF